MQDRLPPATTRPRAESHLSRWLGPGAYVVLGLTVLLWVANAAKPLTMPDAFFNLRFGEEFLSGQWSLTNPGSPTPFATAHWTPTQWSSEIVMAYVDRHFGLAGVCWLMGTLGLLLILAVYRLARRDGGPLPAAFATFAMVVIASASLSPRAQMVSYLFTAVFVAAVLRIRTDGRVRWWLIPLMWVWVTAHGMWPVGLSVVGAGALGIVLETRTRDSARRMAMFVGLMAIAAAATPVGVHAYEAVLAVSSRRAYIPEWAPTNFMSGTNVVLAVCLVGVLIAGLRRRSAMPWTDVLLLVVGLGWALYGARGVPVAATILAPYLARVLQQGVTAQRPPAREGWALGSMFVAAAAALALMVTNQPGAPFQNGSWETRALDALPAGTVVLNEGSLGGYLVWRYPALSITSYGYFDTYTDPEFQRLFRLIRVQPGWVADVQATAAKVALLKADSPLAYGLVQALHWQVVESDATYQLLRAPGSS